MTATAIESDGWQQRLRDKVGEDVFTSWFAGMELLDVIHASGGDKAKLSVPTRFLRSWISQHYVETVKIALRVTSIEIIIRTGLHATAPRAPRPTSVPSIPSAEAPARIPDQAPAPVITEEDRRELGSPLRPLMSFSTFIVDHSNQMAHATALRVADGAGSIKFNPIYLFGGIGYGKTHLLQAIARMSPDFRRVLYLTAEKMLYGVMPLLRRSVGAFDAITRDVDVVLIDDFKFLLGGAQHSLFALALDSLAAVGRQVVLAGDRAPAELTGLDQRLRSRLAGGLFLEIAAPDLALRHAILAQRLAAAQRERSDFEIAPPLRDYIAASVFTGRDIEGVLNRLIAQHVYAGPAGITVELIEATVRGIVDDACPPPVKIEDIQRMVAQHYGITRADLLSPRRTHDVVRPRQVAMFLAKKLTTRSLPEVGRRFGNKDHTTVLHAVRKITELCGQDGKTRADVDALTRLLRGEPPG